MNESEKIFAKAKTLIPGGVNSPVRAFRSVGGAPFFSKSASGAYLTTVDNQELIDFVCTWGPAIHGHNHPAIAKAIETALHKGTSFGTPSPAEVTMAELVIKHVPSVEKVRMCNSGTEATMSAIRLARGFTKRDKIIKFAGCYHGHVDALLVSAGSGALTLGNPDSAGVPKSFAQETIVLPYNDLAALAQAFADYPGQIAAVIVEPYPANCGLILPDNGYLQGMRDLTKAHGALLIFDEVMTGFRVSAGGVQARENITPDLSAMGKIIGGGLPVGAIGGRADIMDYFAPVGPVYQAGTLSGNPLAMAAGIAALEMLDREDLYTDLEAMTLAVRDALTSVAEEKGIPLQVPTAPGMFCLYFSESPVTRFDQATACQHDLFNQIFHDCLKHGVYLPPSSYETCFISTAHRGAPIEKAIDILTTALGKL